MTMSDEPLKEKILKWLLTGEVGISSETMAAHLAELPKPRRTYHPLDPDDFNRCLLLLKEIPELRERLPRMKTASKVWSQLVDRWDEVEQAFLSEAGLGWCNGVGAPRTYQLMKEIGC
jgi:hypothetical protein